MNQQPLETYDSQAVYACGMKLFHRAYPGPLLAVVRHNDGVEANVYPDATGSITLDSPIEILVGESEASYLGEFLCAVGYDPDPVLGVSPVVVAGVNTLYDQSSNINHLINTDTATQPLICDGGVIFPSDWGLSLSLAGGRFFYSSSFEDSVTLHYRIQLDGALGTKYLYRQEGDAFYAKITDSYLDETLGASSAVVFNNENYYRDYTTYDISLNEGSGTLRCLEVVAHDGVLNEPPLYKIENIDVFHSLLVYNGVGEHVRRHVTNTSMAEDIPLLQEKLQRYNPQSYYNFVAGAKAIYGTFSFAGVLGDSNTRMMRIRRKVGVITEYIDLFTDNTGYINLDSPVGNPSHTTSASTLGEWVAHSSYVNTDGIAPVDIYIERLYSQVNDSVDLVGGNDPKLYTAATESLSVSGSNGVVGLDFYVPEDSAPNKGMSLAERFYAKTVVVVYANKDSTLETNTLVSAQYGATIYSKFAFGGLGTYGVTLYDQTNFNFTQEGIDSEVHIVSLFEDAQKLVIDNVEYDVNYDKIPDGIEDTEYEDSTMWAHIGALSGSGSSPHKGYVAAVIFYDDDKYDQRDFIHDYLNTMFGVQNTPFAEPVTYPEITGYKTTEGIFTATGDVEPVYVRAADNIQPGELLLLVGAYNTTGDVKIPYAPYGWELYNDGNFIVSGLAGVGITIMHKIADGTEDAFPLVGVLTTAPTDEAIFWYIRVRNGSTNFLVGDGAFSTESFSVIAPSVDTTGYNTPLALAFMATEMGGGALWNTSGSADGWSDVEGVIAYPEYNPDGVTGGFAFKVVEGDSSGDVHFNQNPYQLTAEGIVGRQIIIPYAPAIAPLPFRTALLDDYPGAAVAYSLRNVSSNYDGSAVRVRRSSDNVEQDISFDSLGNLNVNLLSTFCAGTDGFVVRWYDQSGNARDYTMATTANQWKVYDASTGVVNYAGINGSAVLGVGTAAYSQSIDLSDMHDGNGFTAITVTAQAAGVGRGAAFGTTLRFFTEYDNVTYFDSPTRHAAASISHANGILGFAYRAGSTKEAFQNGSLKITNTDATALPTTTVGFTLTIDTGTHGFEFIWYPSDQSANRAAIESDINDYYQVYDEPRLLNDYPDAAAAYSLRKLNADYTGAAVRVRRASDNLEEDISFLSNGNLNTSFLSAFCNQTDGFIVRFYDQSGNGNDAVQATTSEQPKIYDATAGYLTGLEFVPASNTHLGLDYTFDMTDVSAALVAKADNTGSYAIINAHETTVAREFAIGVNNGTVASTIKYDGNQRSDSDTLSNYDDLFLLTMFADSSTANDSYLNGQACTGTTNPPTTPNTTNNIRIGQRATGSADFSGLIFEFVVWFSDQSANRAAIEANIATFYGIYEPPKLLNSYSGAAAAYSLRQLDTAYTGPAVRVRRDTDNTELNIPFYEGELHTALLNDFCLNANGFVSVWYDQSGNGNDAVQATTASQPKVYDSVTGVIDSLRFDGNDFFTLASTIPIDLSDGFAGFIASNHSSGNNHRIFLQTTAGGLDYAAGGTLLATEEFIIDADPRVVGISAVTGLSLYTYEMTASAGNFYKNGTLLGTDAHSKTNTITPTVAQISRSSGYTGDMKELIIYASDQSANRAAIEANIASYYGITLTPPVAPTPEPTVTPSIAETVSQVDTLPFAVSSYSVTLPLTTEVGDMIFIIAANDDATNEQIFSAPTGFTELSYEGNSTTDAHLAMYYRIADGTEGATIGLPFDTNGNVTDIAVYASRITGVKQTAPIISEVGSTSSVNNVTIGSHASAASNTLFIAAVAFDGGDGTEWSVSGDTAYWGTSFDETILRYPETSISGISLGFISQQQQAQGVQSGVLTVSQSNSDGWIYALAQITGN